MNCINYVFEMVPIFVYFIEQSETFRLLYKDLVILGQRIIETDRERTYKHSVNKGNTEPVSIR